MERVKHLIIFALVFIVQTGVVAIEETTLTENDEQIVMEQTQKPLVSYISFDDVCQKAETHSYDLKLADFDILIAKQDIRGARSEYFPKLYIGASTEYNKNYQDIQNPISTYVGDTYINPYTRYQSMLGITLAYNIFDFGTRRGYLDMAKDDVKMKKLVEKQQLQELHLNLTDTYSRILVTKKQIDLNKKILALLEKNMVMKQRLFDVQEISKNDINEQKVEIERTNRKINELSSMLSESLNLLSFYTNEEYDQENIQVEELQKSDIDPDAFNSYEETLEFQIHEAAISKKMRELKIAKSGYYPKLNLYSRYYLYGSNTNSYKKVYDDFEPSNWSIGASLNMPVFDGMKTASSVQKAKLEVEKLFVERDKAMAEYKNRLATLRSNYHYLNKQIENNETIISELTEKDKSNQRLLSKKVISPIEAIQTQVELLNEQIEYEKNSLTAIAILKGIETLTTYDKD